MRALLKNMFKDQKGITGLETAIILIAFVMVASVFAYVVLSAGLYSAQKAKEAVHAGLDSTMSAVELKGSVFAKMENSLVKYIYLFVGIPPAGHAVDFTSDNASSNVTSKVIISYTDTQAMLPTVPWTLTKLATVNSDDLLDENELFMLTLDMASTNITPYHKFSLELKPTGGPVLAIERTIPGRIDEYVNLH